MLISAYVVLRSGVYRHEIICISDDAEEAKQLAKQALEAEDDGYHGMAIVWVSACGEELLQGSWRWSKKWGYSHQKSIRPADVVPVWRNA